MAYREMTVDAGDVRRAHIFPTRKLPHSRKRGARRAPTSSAQARLNADRAANRLADMLNLNFDDGGFKVGLDYAEPPETLDAGVDNGKRFVRRLRNRAKALFRLLGREDEGFKYVLVTERGANSGRVHHHMVCNWPGTREEFELLWHTMPRRDGIRTGRTHIDRLQPDERGYYGLAAYMVKGMRMRADGEPDNEGDEYRRYSRSRNLRVPLEGREIRSNDYRVRVRDIKALRETPEDWTPIAALYPDYVVTDVRLSHDNDVTGADYITAWMYRRGSELDRRLNGVATRDDFRRARGEAVL